MRTKIDINNWGRKLAYQTFSDYKDPYTGIVTELEITKLIKFCKHNELSFYGCMTYLVLQTMYNINAFKYGYGKENNDEFVYKYDSLAATITVLTENNELSFTRYINLIQS